MHNVNARVLVPVLVALLALSSSLRAEEKDDNEAATKRDIAELRQEVVDLRRLLVRLVEIDEQRLTALRSVLQDAKGRDSEVARRAPEPTAPDRERERERDKDRDRVADSRASGAGAPSRHGGGTISGRVKVTGVSKPTAYVYVEDIAGRMAQGKTATIKQMDKQFVPSVAVVQKGTRIEFPNLDKVFHNVFSLTPGAAFDLGSYGAGDKPGSYVFSQVGAIDVFCNLHSQMAASILVVPNAYFSKVNADGTFELRDVPPGKHKIVAWTPNVPASSQWTTLAAGSSASVEFTLEGREGVPQHTDKKGLPYGSYR